MNKLLQNLVVSIASVALLATSFAIPALATGKSALKATGGIGYTAYGLQRYAQFDAQQTSMKCSTTWNINGVNTVTLTGAYTGYVYNITFTVSGSTVAGSLTDPYFSSIPMNATGSLTGNTITFSYTYPDGGYRGTRTFTGTINASGTVTDGTWNETGPEGISGTWTNGTAFVQESNGCMGKGTFTYSDVDGNYYTVNVQYVKVSANQTWFAGPVISGNVGAGNWLFAEVLDGGTPGAMGDQIWGSFTTQTQAMLGVAMMADPVDGPFSITSGNLVVHN